MTITRLAADLGITRQTIYNWLDKEGIDRLSIQNVQTGELTEEGEQLIRSIKASRQASRGPVIIPPEAQSRIDSLQQACTAQAAQVAALQIQLQAALEERNFLRQILRDKLPAALPAPAEEAAPVNEPVKKKHKKHKHRKK